MIEEIEQVIDLPTDRSQSVTLRWFDEEITLNLFQGVGIDIILKGKDVLMFADPHEIKYSDSKKFTSKALLLSIITKATTANRWKWTELEGTKKNELMFTELEESE